MIKIVVNHRDNGKSIFLSSQTIFSKPYSRQTIEGILFKQINGGPTTKSNRKTFWQQPTRQTNLLVANEKY